MQKNSIQNPTDISYNELKSLLKLGNIYGNPQKDYLARVIEEIQKGNKNLFKSMITIILEIIKKNSDSKSIKQLMLDHVTALIITANPVIISDISNDLLSMLPDLYNQAKDLQEYLTLWKQIYRQLETNSFLKIPQHFINIPTPSFDQLTGQLSLFYRQFSRNLEKYKEKRVQFFSDDFGDSSFQQSVTDESHILQIAYMDIMEMKAIRKKVQSQNLSEENCVQYIIKMKAFLNLRSEMFSGELLAEFNKEKKWAKSFIENHRDYLKRQNPFNEHRNTLAAQSLQQETTELKCKDAQLTNQKPHFLFLPQQEYLGYSVDNPHQREFLTEIKNFNLNGIPIDESRFTQRPPNNTQNRDPKKKYELNQRINDSIIKNNHSIVLNDNRDKMPIQSTENKMCFEPKKKAENTKKLVQISRPSPEQVGMLEESSLSNLSIPIKPKKKDENQENISYETPNRHSVTASSNPFLNSKTNFNPIKNYSSSKRSFKRIFEIDDQNNYFDDQPLIVRHYHNPLNPINFSKSYQKQLSSQSHFRRQSQSRKKRLSEFTSEKKKRKIKIENDGYFNFPDDYAYKPYSVHFQMNPIGFNNFKRNCLEEKFPIYVSQSLFIKCTLKKLNNSKLSVEIYYQNQSIDEITMHVVYKIPKSFKIQKKSKIRKNFQLKHAVKHIFNLLVLQFPLQMCLLDLSYSSNKEEAIPNLPIHLPITIKNFIQLLPTSRDEWSKQLRQLTIQNPEKPFIIERTFELNKDVIYPFEIERILKKQFIDIGASQACSVEEFGCTCFYRDINNLIFLTKIALRVDYIATITIISGPHTTQIERDFMKYYLQILVSLFAKYQI